MLTAVLAQPAPISSATISDEEAVYQFKNCTKFTSEHVSKRSALQREQKEHAGGRGLVDSIQTGDLEKMSAVGQRVAAIRQQVEALDSAVQPVRERAQELMPQVFSAAQRRVDALAKLHQENRDVVFSAVSKKVEAALPSGWYTPAEYRLMILRSLPFREQVRHEANFPASSNIPLVNYVDPITGDRRDVPHASAVENPVVLTGLIDRLDAGIAEATKRQAQLARDFAA